MAARFNRGRPRPAGCGGSRGRRRRGSLVSEVAGAARFGPRGRPGPVVLVGVVDQSGEPVAYADGVGQAQAMCDAEGAVVAVAKLFDLQAAFGGGRGGS